MVFFRGLSFEVSRLKEHDVIIQHILRRGDTDADDTIRSDDDSGQDDMHTR